jgi:hypothetical protein
VWQAPDALCDFLNTNFGVDEMTETLWERSLSRVAMVVSTALVHCGDGIFTELQLLLAALQAFA